MAYSPIPPNVISTANSTTSNLAGAAAFTGTSEDVSSYALIQVSVYSSHTSGTNGLSLQQSSDGTNWDITDTYTVAAITAKVISIQPAAKFFRLVYTNGATLTTSLRIMTVYHWNVSKSSSVKPADAMSVENDFEQTISVLSAYNGATADLMRGDTTNGLDVDVTRLPALVAGSAVVGKVGIDQTTPGTTNLVALAANQSVNEAQIAGTTTLTGNGVTGAGSQRVTIASDNTAFAVNATLSAETTKVIGTVNQGTSPWAVSGTVTANAGTNLNTSALALDATLTGGTARSKITDGTTNAAVKGASTAAIASDPALVVAVSPNNAVAVTGTFFQATQPVSLATNTPTLQSGSTTAVTQATAANLNATVVGTGTFVTQATLAAETTKVIGTVNQGTSPWVTSNATTSVVGNGAAATAQRVTLANDSTGILGTVGTVTTLTGTTTLTPGGGATNLGKAEDAAHASGDTGVFALAVRNDNAATSVTSANADYSQISVDTNGTIFSRDAPSNTATLANVAGSVTSVTLKAANAARRSLVIYNDSTSDMYIAYAATASSTSFTIYLPSLSTTTILGSEYAGLVTGIWISATGNARITETSI